MHDYLYILCDVEKNYENDCRILVMCTELTCTQLDRPDMWCVQEDAVLFEVQLIRVVCYAYDGDDIVMYR